MLYYTKFKDKTVHEELHRLTLSFWFRFTALLHTMPAEGVLSFHFTQKTCLLNVFSPLTN